MSTPTLERAVGRWQIVALALNDVIGSGIYLLPAAAVALLGAGSLGAVVLAGLAVGLVVLCFAEAATYFDQPGSAYLYTRTAFGPFFGFQVGWMTWLTRVASVASLSAGLAQALAYLRPGLDQGIERALVVTASLLVLCGLNTVGVRAGAMTSVVLAVGKLVPLAIFVAAGVFFADLSRIGAQQASESGGLGAAALLLLYAYAGFENTAAAAGEFRRPRRDVPFALLTHLAIVTVVYVAVQAVVMATLPDAGLSQTPLADSAQLFLGAAGGGLLTVGAVISIFGTQANTVFAAPRYLYALAKDGYGPGSLAAVHPRFRTPAFALWVTLLIAWPLALFGDFVGLATLSVVARLFSYLGTAASIPRLRQRRQAPEGAFRLPWGPVIPFAAIALSLAFAASASKASLLGAAVALAVGAVIYRFRRSTDEVTGS